jgi:uncharacterized membrane protein HdeD (DUF308 family)
MTPVVSNSARYWWLYLLRGILLIAAGIVTFRFTVENYVRLGIFFGITILIASICGLVYLALNAVTQWWGWRLLAGLAGVVIGIILFANIGPNMVVRPVILGCYFLFPGIALFGFMGLLKDGTSTIWLSTASTILIFFGFIIMWNQYFKSFTIITWTAVAFLFTGLFSILLALRLKDYKENEFSNSRAAE